MVSVTTHANVHATFTSTTIWLPRQITPDDELVAGENHGAGDREPVWGSIIYMHVQDSRRQSVVRETEHSFSKVPFKVDSCRTLEFK